VPTYQCSDGVDNDGDGYTDYPSDPGCQSTTDTDETDAPAQTYQCSDGVDNDGDGSIDYPLDPGCVSPTDTSETDATTKIGVSITVTPTDNPSTVIPDEPDQPGEPGEPGTSDQLPGNGQSSDQSPAGDGNTAAPGGPGASVQPPKGSTPPGAITPSIIPSISHLFGITPPLREISSGVAITSLAVAVGIGLFSAMLMTPFLFSDLWGLLLALISWRKKKWGVVYDSKTKQPIDPAYVVLHDMAGKEIATCITDIEGRYGFLVDPGTYTISVNKTHYEFPSKRLAGRDHDVIYEDLYFGAPITIERKEQTILKNIPLDPLAADWNETAKREQGFVSFFGRHEQFFRVLGKILFTIGFIFAIFAYLLTPIFWNLLVIIAYILIFILQELNILRPKTSNVVDARNEGLPYALVELYNAHIDQKVATKVTSGQGRFLGLVPKGTYYAKVLKRDSLDSETYTPVTTTGAFDAKRGYVEERIKVDL
jgi:hypothetical protein